MLQNQNQTVTVNNGENTTNDNQSFAELLESYLPASRKNEHRTPVVESDNGFLVAPESKTNTLSRGQLVQATVLTASPSGAWILAGQTEGYVPADRLYGAALTKGEERLFVVDRINDKDQGEEGGGYSTFAYAAWNELSQAREDNTTLTVRVTRVIKTKGEESSNHIAGFQVNVMGMKGFMPATLTAPPSVLLKDQHADNTWWDRDTAKHMIGKTVPVKVIQVDQPELNTMAFGRIVVDNRKTLELKIGEKVHGEVMAYRSVPDRNDPTRNHVSGVFVDVASPLRKVRMFVYRNELILPGNASVEEAYPLGRQLELEVIPAPQNSQWPVALRHKGERVANNNSSPTPRRKARTESRPEPSLQVGQKVQGKVTGYKTMPDNYNPKEPYTSGLFVELSTPKAPRMFVFRGELALSGSATIEESYPVGHQLELEVIAGPNGQISLSHRNIARASITAGTVMDGIVLEVIEFGVFVKLGSTPFRGLIHISELKKKNIFKNSLKEGQQIQVRVKSNDQGRIGLEMYDGSDSADEPGATLKTAT